MSDAVPLVSVVIAARDASRSLPRVLGGLAAQTLPADRFEVLVVDNDSSDDTAAVARAAGAEVVEASPPNRSLARNQGAVQARGSMLAFLDADCVPEPGWLAALVEGLREHPLCGGHVVAETADPPTAIERLELSWRFDREQAVTVSGWVGAANFGVRAEAFEMVGGFDPSFRVGGEDVELCLRAGRLGLALGWCPGAVVSHPAEHTLRGLLRRGLRHGFASTHHWHAIGGGVGRRYWRHPRPLVAGDWALRRFGIDPSSLVRSERRRLLALARLEYGARILGSIWAELRLAGKGGDDRGQ